MPKIATYEANDNLGLRPTETGINAVAQAARRVEGDYSQAAEAQAGTGHRIASAIEGAGGVAVKYIDHAQISMGAKNLTGLAEAKTKEWNEIAKRADPNDPTVARRFLEENLEPQIEEFKKGFITEAGQKFAETHADQLRTHMFHKTSADMSTLAGEAARENTRKTVNSLSNTVRGDPTSMDFSLKTLEGSVGAMVDSSPTLSVADAGRAKTELMQKGKEEIIKSAAMGYIEKTGEVPPWVSDPKYSPYINGTELKQFAQAARYYERLGKSEQRAAQQQEEHAARLDLNDKMNKLERSTLPEKVGDRPTLPPDYWDKIREYTDHPGAKLDPGRIHRAVTNGDVITNRMNKPEPLARISNATEVGLIRRFRATDESRLEPGEQEATKAVYEAYDKGELTTAGFRRMLNEATLRTPEDKALAQDRKEFFKQHSLVIDPSFGATAEGTQKIYFAEMEARRQEAALRKAGKDPHLVYDPRSPEFFGRPENMGKFKATLTDLMRGLKQEGEGGAPKPPAGAPPDARQAPDGLWYVPDPKRPGKFLRVGG